MSLRLEADPDPGEFGLKEPGGPPELIPNRFDAHLSWSAGRAGMLYRDLIPGRLGALNPAGLRYVLSAGEDSEFLEVRLPTKQEFDRIDETLNQARLTRKN